MMALVASDLATAIASALNTQMMTINTRSATALNAYHDKLASAIAGAVVAYLTSNAEVLPGTMTVTAIPVSGKGRIQ